MRCLPLSVRALARAERAAFADLLDGLTAEQWAAPSLCDGWTVRDVAAHTVAYLDQGRFALLAAYARARIDVDRLNSHALARTATVGAEELAGQMRSGVDPCGAGALYRCRVALIECVIHQQDVRRALGVRREVPVEAVRAALSFAIVSPVIHTARGVRLVTTDADWAAGRGPEVYGTGEALLLAITGRLSAVMGALDGEGVALLSQPESVRERRFGPR